MEPNWMGELFVNIFLHSYIAEKEPALLPALTVSENGSSQYRYSNIKIYLTSGPGKFYTQIAQQSPQNYGWINAAGTWKPDASMKQGNSCHEKIMAGSFKSAKNRCRQIIY